MGGRISLYALLTIVAAAAAVLSFAALRDLATTCGFTTELSWLLPITVDAGAAAASIVWLARWTPPGARRYGRTFALLLLCSSVGGNALGHGLEAYNTRPHWLVVVGVSAIAPAVLGALVHLLVLVGRRQPSDPVGVVTPPATPTDTNQPAIQPTNEPEPPRLAAVHTLPTNTCGCGCGAEVGTDSRGRTRRFVIGHNKRVKAGAR